MISIDQFIAHRRDADQKLFLVATLADKSKVIFNPETGEKEIMSGSKKLRGFTPVAEFLINWKSKKAKETIKKAVSKRKTMRFRFNEELQVKEKECTKCFIYKGMDSFYMNQLDRPMSACKECTRENCRKYRKPKVSHETH
jgi:hypothetical protein